jgi:predicted DNA-binding transcriptional regulator AlpA
VRLLDRHEVCAIAGVRYPTLWKRMRDGDFPRSRVWGGRSMWRSDEVQAWLDGLKLRPLKGDAAAEGESR